MSLDVLKSRLDEIRKHIDTKRGEMIVLNNQKDENKKKRDKLEGANDKLLIMKKLIEESCSEARENGRQLLSEVATTSVQSVFGENTSIDIPIENKDGIPTASVDVVVKNESGTAIIDPTNSDGGGLADIVSLSLLLAIGSTVEDNYAPYILDEPTKYVSKGTLAEKSSDFLVGMVEYTGKQTIISTHDENLLDVGGVRYNIVKDENTGISKVSLV